MLFFSAACSILASITNVAADPVLCATWLHAGGNLHLTEKGNIVLPVLTKQRSGSGRIYNVLMLTLVPSRYNITAELSDCFVSALIGLR